MKSKLLTLLALCLCLAGCDKKKLAKPKVKMEPERQAKDPASLLSEGTFVTEVPGYTIYIGKLDKDPKRPHKWTMKNVMLNRIEDGALIQRTRAAHGEVEYLAKEKSYIFRLFDAQTNVRSDKLSIIFGGELETSPNKKGEYPVERAPEWMPMAAGEIVFHIDLTDIEKSDRHISNPTANKVAGIWEVVGEPRQKMLLRSGGIMNSWEDGKPNEDEDGAWFIKNGEIHIGVEGEPVTLVFKLNDDGNLEVVATEAKGKRKTESKGARPVLKKSNN